MILLAGVNIVKEKMMTKQTKKKLHAFCLDCSVLQNGNRKSHFVIFGVKSSANIYSTNSAATVYSKHKMWFNPRPGNMSAGDLHPPTRAWNEKLKFC